ncbi:MAG: helical backbone metal receptor [Endomicrobium sp.]|jgi:iron complex transport system substrate-binding protein|nr:helical backbone metal receptor [Endomicrobium sp.]
MRKIVYIITLLFLLSGIGCAKEYKRIISLAPSVTESLYELGLEQSVQGVTIYCPKGIVKKEIIGTLLEPDIEKIILLKPDLIISTKDGNMKAIVEKLNCLGFEVYVMETAKSFNDICINYCNLAKKLDKEKEAKEIIDTAKHSVEKIRDKLNGFNKLKMFWEIGTRPLYTAGKQSFVNDYNNYTKTINIYDNVDVRYIPVNIEDVIKRNPDIIVLVNAGDINSEEIINWNKYKMIKAVKNNKVFIIDISDIFIPTPLTFAKNTVILAKIIYEDIFNAK